MKLIANSLNLLIATAITLAAMVSAAQAQMAYYAVGVYAPSQPVYNVPAPVPAAYVPPAAMMPQPMPQPTGYLDYNGRYAAAPAYMPVPVQIAVNAGNELQNKPYRMGGGHSRLYDNAYDCSGSVSYTLIKAGLLKRPLSSKEFANYGEPGPGRFITLYVKPGSHVFMSICGLRFDTSGGSGESGPRWRATARNASGFIIRHPFGL